MSGVLLHEAFRKNQWSGKMMSTVDVEETVLSASEALYGFMGWLTGRDERVCFSGKDDASPAAELVDQFCKHNNLPEPREGWTDLYSLPKSGKVEK